MYRSIRQSNWLVYVLLAVALSVLILLFLGHRTAALTTVPTKMNFQGRLTDSSGNVMANGTYNMKLRLYTVSSGGSTVWTEDRLVSAAQGVTVTNGLFSIKLGDISALSASLFASGDLYLEVELPTPATATSASPTWTEGPMTPRSQLATSAYAYNAETLDGLDSAAFAQLGSTNTFTAANDINVSSANAFLVRNGATNLFKVDTSTSAVTIGTSDTTAALLVLDTKTSATDPTGINGGMYYNSNSLKFRCYENGAWKDCITTSGSNATLQQSYFASTGTTTPEIKLDTTRTGVDIQDADTTIAGNLFTVRASNAGTLGTALFSVTSTGVTQVKTTGDVNLLQVDTANSQINVGASDTTGALFVLDTKTGSGDPSGVAGGSYYNSNGTARFRCYEAAAWKDCIPSLQGAYDQDSSGTADITTTSAAKTFLFKAGATFDSATLFDIQDAGGTQLFTVDSTNGHIYVGDSTADGTGALLVLDTKNTATDPTGVDGAMYYNSDAKAFKCYKNGLWTDCNFTSLRSEWVLQEDFNSNTITAGTAADLGNIGNNNWTFVSIGTGGTLSRTNVGTDASNRDRIGVMQMNSPATVSTGVSLRLDNTGIAGVPSNMTVEFDFAPVNAAAATGQQTITRIGLLDSTTTAAPTDGMYFQYSTTTTAGNWFRCTQTTCVDTGVARTTTANTYQRFKIQTNSAGTAVEFFINETSVGTASTNLPGTTASYGPTINTSTVDATIRQWKIDYFQIYRSLTTLR
ncbi:MAG TPA: hypothetical protein PL051_04935 [Candidatus Saccharibacteria bacterium]|nr:hypothetical protein [Candidatus Saccharibacteria bacterium]